LTYTRARRQNVRVQQNFSSDQKPQRKTLQTKHDDYFEKRPWVEGVQNENTVTLSCQGSRHVTKNDM